MARTGLRKEAQLSTLPSRLLRSHCPGRSPHRVMPSPVKSQKAGRLVQPYRPALDPRFPRKALHGPADVPNSSQTSRKSCRSSNGSANVVISTAVEAFPWQGSGHGGPLPQPGMGLGSESVACPRSAHVACPELRALPPPCAFCAHLCSLLPPSRDTYLVHGRVTLLHALPCSRPSEAVPASLPGLEDNYFANKLHQREKRALTLGSKTGSQTTTGPGAAVSLAKEEDKDQHPTLSKGWCSTWGGGHFSTFDKSLYDFYGTCNYVFAAACDPAASPDFNIQLRRGRDRSISRIIIQVGPSVVTVQNRAISVKDAGLVSLPYTSNGIQIMPFGHNVRLVAKLLEMELVVMWNDEDYLLVMVETKYMAKTCGLCGNFDSEDKNDFRSEGSKLLEPYEYAILQKLDDPNEICAYEELPVANRMPRNYTQLCLQLLNQVGPNCNVSKDAFATRCQLDLEGCSEAARPNCSCHTLSEYSRQCAMSGQPVRDWRRPGFCSLGKCPANQVYKECGAPCVKTCSNPAHSCSSFCTFGCFCPEGTVLDDISKNHSCVPVSQCPCVLNGVTYAPGQAVKAACRTCRCASGQWVCAELPCPGRCSLEGGSFITTFDSRPYRFHGTCTYILVKSPCLPDNGTLMAVYDKSGYSHSETSLRAIIYSSTKDQIVISQDELLTDDGDAKWLPYQTGNITIFRQTSTHVQMSTTFGLELTVELRPVFQAYVKVGLQFKGHTRGLCGNYNGDTTDDFLTSMNIIEGTASLFVDSWRSGNCPSALERETDPCSMSQLNKMCAETHCSVLVKKGAVFEACHALVNPTPFYKRCVYQACNYEETFPYICSALGSYARMCASMGIILANWRSAVENCTISCTGNQTFSYKSQACDRTCLSLADPTLECHPSDIPVDGCNCPEGTYLDHRNECVRQSRCPCYLEDQKFILAEQSTVIQGVPWPPCSRPSSTCRPNTVPSVSRQESGRLSPPVWGPPAGGPAAQPLVSAAAQKWGSGPGADQRRERIGVVQGGAAPGCYNCTVDQYFDHEDGRCVPCWPHPTTTRQSTGGAETTTVFTPRPLPSSPSSPTSGRSTAAVPSSTQPRITGARPAHPARKAPPRSEAQQRCWHHAGEAPGMRVLQPLVGGPPGPTQPRLRAQHSGHSLGHHQLHSSGHLLSALGNPGHLPTGLHGEEFPDHTGHFREPRLPPNDSHAIHSSVHCEHHSNPRDVAMAHTDHSHIGWDHEKARVSAVHCSLTLTTATSPTASTPTGTPTQSPYSTTTLPHTVSSGSSTPPLSTAPSTSSVTTPRHSTTKPIASLTTTTVTTSGTSVPHTGTIHTSSTIPSTGTSYRPSTVHSTISTASITSTATTKSTTHTPHSTTSHPSTPTSTTLPQTTMTSSVVSSGVHTLSTTANKPTATSPTASTPVRFPSTAAFSHTTTTFPGTKPFSSPTSPFTSLLPSTHATTSPVTSSNGTISFPPMESTPSGLPVSPSISSSPSSPVSTGPASSLSPSSTTHSSLLSPPLSTSETPARTTLFPPIPSASPPPHSSTVFETFSTVLPNVSMSTGLHTEYPPSTSSAHPPASFSSPVSPSGPGSSPTRVPESPTILSTRVTSATPGPVSSSFPHSTLPASPSTQAFPSRATASSAPASPVTASQFPSMVPSASPPSVTSGVPPLASTTPEATSTLKTSFSTPALPTASTRFTTSRSTTRTTGLSTSHLPSSTLGLTRPSVPTTSLTSSPPGPATTQSTGLLTSPASSPAPSAPSSTAGACTVKEYPAEITYQGCTVNTTLTRCEGFCPSWSRVSPDTLQTETWCGCCQPLTTYTRALQLPCSDPARPGSSLVVHVQMFSSCVCEHQHCQP
ncbi:mucin-6-like [Gracilinanus agilis]|uniref:mucin-6-like n=1 Tax=Gracilinanus agilis TaxID=191870 RepID=UPI001CFEE84E|nr:mucin-6-like [Gracilinanus agilis]